MGEAVNVVDFPLLALVLLHHCHLELMVRDVPNLNRGITTSRKDQLLLHNRVIVKGQHLNGVFVHDETLDVPHFDAGLLPVMDAEVIAT